MNEKTWIKGMALLVANLKAPDLTPEMATLRGDTYRRKLGHLSDEVWLYAVDAALEEPGGWFPGIGDLLDHAARAPVPAPAAALPDDTRTVEEKRADAKRLVGVLRAAVDGPDAPAVESSQGLSRAIERKPVVATDERLEALKRQAQEITAASSAEGGM